MATRLRYSSAAAPVSVAFPAGYEETEDATLCLLSFVQDGSPLATVVGDEASATDQIDVAVRGFVSEPLAAGTVFATSDTIKGQIRALESGAGANATPQLVVQVVSNDGSTVRATLLDFEAGAAPGAAAEIDTALTSIPFPRTSPSTLDNGYTIVAGDRLAVFPGARVFNTTATNFNISLRFGCPNDGTADLTDGSTTETTDLVPWLEFSNTFALAAGGTVAVGRDLETPWTIRAAVGRDSVLPWTIRTRAARDLAAPWTIRALAGRDLAVPWILRALAARDLAVPWTIRAAVGRDLVAPWLIRSLAGRDLQLDWTIQGLGLVAVGRDLVVPWTVRAAVGKDLAAPWTIRAAVGRDLVTPWWVLVPAGRDLALPWAIRAAAGAELKVRWTVQGLAGRDLVLAWQIGAGVVFAPVPAGQYRPPTPGRVAAARPGRPATARTGPASKNGVVP